MRRLLFTLLVLIAPTFALAENRVALVIGNSDYRDVSFLPNAAKDGRDVAAKLRALNFTVFFKENATRAETLALALDMRRTLKRGDLALFYFAGHGVQIGAENYLLPIDAAGETESALKAASVSLQTILYEMEKIAGQSVVILDACRDNPFQARLVSRTVGGPARGLAKVDAGVGAYIAFSTQPGNVALDGVGDNSPFTAALLRHMDRSDEDLHAMMRRVRADVVAATERSQIPWENSSLLRPIYLNPGADAPAATPAPQPDTVVAAREGQEPDFTHQVAGLDPNGDGFLALRQGITRGAQRLAKMTEGTRLKVFAKDGPWLKVATETGLSGWAHSNWIRRINRGADEAGLSCDALWLQRNAIFARNGYCFRGARGQRAFGNEGCRQGLSAADIPLSAVERAEVDRLVAAERRQGCR